MFNSILFVCTGNICRSPLAEFLMKDKVARNKVQADISSAGIGALIGHSADKHVHTLLNERGVCCQKHVARQFSEVIMENSDIILVMEKFHQYNINKVSPSSRGKVFLLGQWSNFEIPDPYKQDIAAFREAMEKIEQGLEDWISKLFG